MVNFYQTRWYVLPIFLLGVALSIVNFQHILIEETILNTVIGAFFPLIITVSVSVIAVWIWWRDWKAEAITQLALWLAFGFLWMLIVGIGNMLYEFAEGTPPAHQWYLLATFISYGSIPALLTGWVDIQRRTGERSLQQYKQTVESSKDLLAAIDQELTFLFANETYRQYQGVEATEITGRVLPDVIGNEQYTAIESDVRKALSGETVQTDLTREHPERGERILDVRVFPLKDNSGEISGAAAAMRDVTADRQREKAIKRESEYRRLMYEVNQTLVRGEPVDELAPKIADIIGSGSLFACSFVYLFESTAPNVVCASESEFDSTDVSAFHTPEYIDEVFEAGVFKIDDVTESPYDHHEPATPSHAGIAVAIEHQDEQFGILTVHFPPDSEPTSEEIEILGTVGSDLGRSVYNQTLRAEHRSLADIVKRIDDPVLLQNLDGTFRVINEGVAELTTMEKDDLVGKDETAVFDEDTARVVQDKRERVIESEDAVSYQVTATFPDGRERAFSTTCYPYFDDSGELDGSIAIYRDVSDLKARQRQLEILDRVLRHNVNNNMNVVQGYAELLQKETSGEFKEHATKIVSTSKTLLDTSNKQRKITEFLSDPPPMETIAIEETLERTVNRVQTDHPHAAISMECSAELCRANRAIGNAFEELLTNAIIHSDTDHPRVTIDEAVRDDQVIISVADTNQTMSEMDREILTGGSVMDALHHGSGLGLWFVKLIVDHSDGTVGYEENEPRGNIVRISLPLEQGI